MAFLQLLKSSPSVFHLKFTCLCWEFNSNASVKRSIRLRNSGIASGYRRFRVACRAEETDNQTNGEESPESLFMKELKRRGMAPTSLLDEKNKSVVRDEKSELREEDGGWSNSKRKGVTTNDERNLSNQMEKSRALNSEGLEGLIPRAKLLLTLGGTFFLAFWPLILATVAFFCALYLYFGPEFIHDGNNTLVSPPPYMDPYKLLEEERVYEATPLPN